MSFYSEIVCDACSNACGHGSLASKKQLTEKARECGWSIGKYHLCPECRKNRRQLIKDGWLK